MARIVIEFDTANESLEEVVAKLGVKGCCGKIATATITDAAVTALKTEQQDDGEKLPGDDSKVLPPGTTGDNEQEEVLPPVTLDGDGVPWDERIHTGSKVINSGDKKWKKKKGVDAALHTTITAELKAAQTAIRVAAGFSDPLADDKKVDPPPGPTTNNSGWLFPEIIKLVSDRNRTDMTFVTKVNAALANAGLAEDEFALLGTKPECFDLFMAELELTK